jgi:hypothetical protein
MICDSVKSSNVKDQNASHLVHRNRNSNRTPGAFGPRGKNAWLQCADRVPAWRLGADGRSDFFCSRDCRRHWVDYEARFVPHWSAALGRIGIFFWLSYIPLPLWAMESNWNCLFLSELRFRLAVIFAVTGILLQVGLWMVNLNWLTSLANIIFIIVLRATFSSASNIMHPPPSPIFNSGNYLIVGFFLAMIILALVAAYFLTLVFLKLTKESA